MLALPHHLNQLLFPQSSQVNAGRRSTDTSDYRKLGSSAGMPVHQHIKHSRAARIANCSRNSGYPFVDLEVSRHTSSISEVFPKRRVWTSFYPILLPRSYQTLTQC